MINRLAILSVHTSPLAPLGGKKTGGMNVYVRELAQELGKRGIQVDVFTRVAAPHTPEIDYSLGDNVRVVSVTAGPAQTLDPLDVYTHVQQFAAGVIAFATKQNVSYDLVYAHYWLSGWVANKLKEVWGTPFVQMFHTLGHMKNRIDGKTVYMPVMDTRTTIETRIVDWADRIIAATPAEQSQLLWLYRTDRRKIVVIPPGVNEARFQPMPMMAAKAQIGCPPDCQILLFVGRLEPLKGVDTILQALNEIQRTQPDVLRNTRFAIIGGDPDNPTDSELSRLMALSDALHLQEMVSFLGAKEQALLPQYYAAATAVIMPSDYESFGMVALEAMAMGTPVIASEVGGLAYLVDDHKTGYLVPTREPATLAARILKLIQHPDERETMSQHAAQHARDYAWSLIADQLILLFEDVLERRSGIKKHA